MEMVHEKYSTLLTEFSIALTTILPILFQYCYKCCYSDNRNLFNRNESGRFGTIKSDSTHHFFRNACTKSGSLQFSQFSSCWLILSVCWFEFWLSLWKIARCLVILLLPLLIYTRFKQFDYISSDTRPSIICLRDTACTFVTSSAWNAGKTWSLRKKYDIPPGNNVL